MRIQKMIFKELYQEDFDDWTLMNMLIFHYNYNYNSSLSRILWGLSEENGKLKKWRKKIDIQKEKSEFFKWIWVRVISWAILKNWVHTNTKHNYKEIVFSDAIKF